MVKRFLQQACDLVKDQSLKTLVHSEWCYLFERVTRLVNEIPMVKDTEYLYLSPHNVIQGESGVRLNDLVKTNSHLVWIDVK